MLLNEESIWATYQKYLYHIDEIDLEQDKINREGLQQLIQNPPNLNDVEPPVNKRIIKLVIVNE